jgi:hypothetical protein
VRLRLTPTLASGAIAFLATALKVNHLSPTRTCSASPRQGEGTAWTVGCFSWWYWTPGSLVSSDVCVTSESFGSWPQQARAEFRLPCMSM